MNPFEKMEKRIHAAAPSVFRHPGNFSGHTFRKAALAAWASPASTSRSSRRYFSTAVWLRWSVTLACCLFNFRATPLRSVQRLGLRDQGLHTPNSHWPPREPSHMQQPARRWQTRDTCRQSQSPALPQWKARSPCQPRHTQLHIHSAVAPGSRSDESWIYPRGRASNSPLDQDF